MRTTCRHCFSPADYINVRTTQCPECSEPKDKVKVGEWVHRSTKDGTLADARAHETVRAAQRAALEDAQRKPESA